jgi:Tfp pilus assembly protein PilN
MIKINLLPAYVLEKHLARRTAIIVALVIVAQLAALGFAVLKANGAMAEEKLRLQYWTEEAKKVSTADGLKGEVAGRTGPYQAYVDFAASMGESHRKWAWLWEEMARWVDSKVVLSSVNINGTNVQLQGATDSLESAKRWYLNTMRCYLYSSVQLSVAVPGWQPPVQTSTLTAFGTGGRIAPPGGPPGQVSSSKEDVPVTLACTLKPEYIITPPAPPAAGAAVPGGAATVSGPRAPTGGAFLSGTRLRFGGH